MANYPVSVVYDDGSDVQETSFNLTAVLLSKIEVTTNPAKMAYRTGETMNFTGIVITATYDDESTADVTNRCVFTPATGEAFESPVEIVYAEGQDEKTCSLALTEIVLQRIYIASQPTKTAYKAGEALNYTGLTVKAVYSDESEIDVTGQCSYSAEAGQAFNPGNDTSIEISYLDCSVFLNLTAITLTGISITTNPAKMSYEDGEVIDYSGLVVTASYSDSSTAIVTNSCTITPRAGKVFAPDTDSTAEISYVEDGEEFTATLMLTDVYLVSIEVTTYPTKTAYKHDERIRYAGMVVTASYSDDSSNDVTSECTITPRNNKEFDEETDTNVTIEYSEGQNTATCTLSLTLISLTALQVTTNPLKMSYSSGESFDYTGIVITASYSDNTTADVTDKCTFAPSAGTKFSSGATTVTIDYTEGQNTQTCTLSLTETATELIVATMPDKTNYQPGEEMDYTGAVIKMRHLDGSTHTVTDFCDFSPSISGETITVTVKCAPPVTPYVFDQNSGYIDNGVWKVENPTRTYIDIYRVTAGHKYLLTLGITVGSRFRAMFTTTDVSQATANVTGTTIINTNSPAAYANVEYTAPSNGYIAIGKDNVGVSGIKTYLYDSAEIVKTVTTEFTCSTIAIESIAVTPPVKTRYRAGEKYDYTGAVVTATYSDGSLGNVTEFASFSPANGSTVTSDNPSVTVVQQVLVSCGGQYATFNLTTGGVALVYLSVTPPNKISYYEGELLYSVVKINNL